MKAKKEDSKLAIRNSTIEFLIFTQEEGKNSIEVRYKDDTIWLSQKLMAELFDTSTDNIGVHLKNIYESEELQELRTTEESSVVQKEGNRAIKRNVKFYNLDAIIAVGYRVNSKRATQFRQWATSILKEFAIKGYVLDRERLENGNFLGHNYFEDLLAEIREIRLSERLFYQKITDIYATSIDYNKNAPITREFFATVQNKMHFAIHGHTAAELIMERADSKEKNMGLSTWKNSPDGKIIKTDVSIGKNYLKKEELESLGRIVGAFLDLAEERAKRQIPMTMEDWRKRVDKFLEFDEREILKNAGTITAEIAKEYAESEFDKYRIIQDKLYKSDFDNELTALAAKIK